MNELDGVSWSIAFAAGLLSFLSPCVAPIVPGYLAFLSGAAITTADDRTAAPRRTERIVIASVLFVLGFSAVFVALGATAGTVGGLLQGHRIGLNRLSGAAMIAMGLFVLGVIRAPRLYQERRLHFIDRPYGPLGTTLLGMAFGLGWTPCIGPVLASILLYAGSAETAQEGAVLLSVYSAGLGLPFIATAVGLSRVTTALASFKRHLWVVNAASGALLIGMGTLFLTNNGYVLTYLNVVAQRVFDLGR